MFPSPFRKPSAVGMFYVLAVFIVFSSAVHSQAPASAIPDFPSCDPDTTRPFEEPYEIPFMIKLDTAVNSAANRREDIVQFSTIDDLTAKLTRDVYKQTVTFDPRTADNSRYKVECERVAVKGSDHVFIPAGTRVYGRVDSRRGKSPFWLGGKAQLFIRLEYMLLKNGTRLNLDFDRVDEFTNLLPCNDDERKSRQRRRGTPADKAKKGQQCIEGRRPQIDWASGIFAPLVGAYEKVVAINDGDDDDGLDVPFSLTSAAAFGKLSGFGDLLNGTTASINAGQIFLVKLVRKPTP